MVERQAPKIAIVGRNIAAALWLKALERHAADVNLTWHQTDDERLMPDSKMWLIVPDSLRNELKEDVPAIPVKTPLVFLRHSRRMEIKRFLETEGEKAMPLPVRRKLLASALWSDLSPSLWKNRAVRRPDPDWIKKIPASFHRFQNENLWIVPKAMALKKLEATLVRGGVKVAHGDCGVFGIEPGSKSEGNKIILNAPFGLSLADKIVWTSFGRPIKDEGSRAWRKLKPLTWKASAQWVSRGTWVESSKVAALPLFSIWLDPKKSDDFHATGVLPSRALKRLFCVDSSVSGGPKNSCWLQIDELEFLDTAHADRALPFTDDFLRELCPNLTEGGRKYSEERLEENFLFEDPAPKREAVGGGIDVWLRGSLGSPSEAAENWFFKNVKVKKK